MADLPDGKTGADAVDRLHRDRKLAAADALGCQVIEGDAENSAMWVALGRVKLERYLPEEALACFERALNCPLPTSSAVAWQIAALSRLRRFDDARDTGDAGLSRFPRSPDILVAYARTYCDRHQWADALRLLEQAIEAVPHSIHALKWRVAALRRLRRFDEAEAAAREAIEQRPDEPDLLVEMGWIFDDQARFEESLTLFERAVQL